jgi:hypothetical protein
MVLVIGFPIPVWVLVITMSNIGIKSQILEQSRVFPSLIREMACYIKGVGTLYQGLAASPVWKTTTSGLVDACMEAAMRSDR